MRRLAELLKTGYRKTSLWLFGNSIGIKVNILYVLYLAALKVWCRFRPPFARGARAGHRYDIADKALEIRMRGFAKTDPLLDREFIQATAHKVDALFARQEKVVTTLREGGLIRLRAALVEVPELEQFLLHADVRDTVERYFGGYFKVFSCDVYRTIPMDPAVAAEQFGSLKWHFDNCPSVLFKIMVYLTDTAVDTGAISLVPKPKSQDLKRRGFWDRNNADRFDDELKESAVYLEGSAGTTLFFSTHYCIHKATLPLRRHRDVAVFLVQPAFSRQQMFSAREREIYSYNFGYCVNPFVGTPLRYGEE